MCRIAVADGITGVVVTPHIHPGRYENATDSIARSCNQLRRALIKYDIPLQVGFAAEVRLTDQLMSQVENGDIPFYGDVDGYKVMLLEFPHSHIIPGSHKLVRWLLNQKIRPLIAHPERNKQVMKDPAQLQPFIQLGCWLQLTAGSVVGRFGKRAREVSQQLLDRDQVQVIASDAHNTRVRQPVLSEAYENIVACYGVQRAEKLLLHNPANIALGQLQHCSDGSRLKATIQSTRTCS